MDCIWIYSVWIMISILQQLDHIDDLTQAKWLLSCLYFPLAFFGWLVSCCYANRRSQTGEPHSKSWYEALQPCSSCWCLFSACLGYWRSDVYIQAFVIAPCFALESIVHPSLWDYQAAFEFQTSNYQDIKFNPLIRLSFPSQYYAALHKLRPDIECGLFQQIAATGAGSSSSKGLFLYGDDVGLQGLLDKGLICKWTMNRDLVKLQVLGTLQRLMLGHFWTMAYRWQTLHPFFLSGGKVCHWISRPE